MKTGFFVALSLALFVGGIAIMGYAVTLSSWQGPVFVLGVISIALSFALPIHLLPSEDQRG